MRSAALVVLVVAWLVARTAVAEPVSTQRRVAATAAAVFPGVLVRGLGSWLVHEKRTAKRLFGTAVIGLGGAAVGGAPIGLSGGSPYATPGLPILVAGSGLLVTTWIADIAVAAGVDRPGHARGTAPWAVELGTAWLHDAYRERGLVRGAGTVELGRLGLGAGAFVDAEGDSLTIDGELRVRILGAAATPATLADGSRLHARAVVRRHRDDLDRATLVTGEAELVARVELAHLDPVLRHSSISGSASGSSTRATRRAPPATRACCSARSRGARTSARAARSACSMTTGETRSPAGSRRGAPPGSSAASGRRSSSGSRPGGRRAASSRSATRT